MEGVLSIDELILRPSTLGRCGLLSAYSLGCFPREIEVSRSHVSILLSSLKCFLLDFAGSDAIQLGSIVLFHMTSQ